MAFTRAFDDKDRINMFQNQDVNNLKYMVNVPGNGTRPYYIEDPHIRLQKFGANISHNIVNVNSGLKGIARQLDTECLAKKNGNEQMLQKNYSEMSFPVISSAVTDESRAMMPAWQLRGIEQNHWNYLLSNPQDHAEVNFANNVSSRIVEKDYYDSGCKNNI